MTEPALLFRGESEWKGAKYITELYSASEETCLAVKPATQIHAICFVDPHRIVFYKNIQGFLGNPGGGVDAGETYEQTVRRELIEEAQLELVDFRFFGYEYIINVADNSKNAYFLRAAAKVRLLDAPINDPCGKAIGRIVVPVDEASKILNWGDKGEQLIKLAVEKYKSTLL